MTRVKLIREIVREKLNNSAAFGTSQFINSIRPIYGSNDEGRPVHIGSCILLESASHKYILTAAHIIDKSSITTLYIGGEKKLIPLESDICFATKSKENRKQDHYDFAWIKTTNEIESNLGNVDFISEQRYSLENTTTLGRQYLALGYPNTKNKKSEKSKSRVRVKYKAYSATVCEDDQLCKKLSISGNEHFFLKFNHKYLRDSEGNQVSSFSPHGMSGGALIDMGNIANPNALCSNQKPDGKLIGMLIEVYNKFDMMIAVKLSTIIQQIQAFNDN